MPRKKGKRPFSSRKWETFDKRNPGLAGSCYCPRCAKTATPRVEGGHGKWDLYCRFCGYLISAADEGPAPLVAG